MRRHSLDLETRPYKIIHVAEVGGLHLQTGEAVGISGVEISGETMDQEPQNELERVAAKVLTPGKSLKPATVPVSGVSLWSVSMSLFVILHAWQHLSMSYRLHA